MRCRVRQNGEKDVDGAVSQTNHPALRLSLARALERRRLGWGVQLGRTKWQVSPFPRPRRSFVKNGQLGAVICEKTAIKRSFDVSISGSLVRRDHRGRGVKVGSRPSGGSAPKRGRHTMRFTIVTANSARLFEYHKWRLNRPTVRWLEAVLSQGGEFAFVLLGADAIQGITGEPMANLLALAVTLSLAARRLGEVGDEAFDRQPHM